MDLRVLTLLQYIIFASIFFVWVVRYSNIVEEFKQYSLPDSLRDVVGILKLSFAFMLVSSEQFNMFVGSLGMTFLMICAQFIHFKQKTALAKRLPSLFLLVASALIVFQTKI